MPDNKQAPAPLTAAQVKHLLKDGSIILWKYRDDVEEGHVVFIDERLVAVCWLDGYRSRNDDVPFEDVLAVHSTIAPKHRLGCFTGRGFITEAGVKWAAEQKAREEATAAAA